jgi:cytoskeletal protein CcmA (bactofilin family)
VSSAISTIDRDLLITGNVASKGEIHLDGAIRGDVECVALMLGDNSRLEGSVVAEEVVIRVHLVGSVRALRVSLQSSAHVEGDVIHQSLTVEQGAFFDGKSTKLRDDGSSNQKSPPPVEAEPKPDHEPLATKSPIEVRSPGLGLDESRLVTWRR